DWSSDVCSSDLDAVCTSSANTEQSLHHDGLFIKPAVLCCCHMHRILTTDLIDVGGHTQLLLHPAHDIQIRHAGLHHHHISAFFQIEQHFVDGIVAVGRDHLITGLVTLDQVAGRTYRIPEGPVIGGGILGRISHDPGIHMLMLL